MYTFKNTVHSVTVILAKVTGFRREGSQIFVHDGGIAPLTVSFKETRFAEEAEKEFETALANANKPKESNPA